MTPRQFRRSSSPAWLLLLAIGTAPCTAIAQSGLRTTQANIGDKSWLVTDPWTGKVYRQQLVSTRQEVKPASTTRAPAPSAAPTPSSVPIDRYVAVTRYEPRLVTVGKWNPLVRNQDSWQMVPVTTWVPNPQHGSAVTRWQPTPPKQPKQFSPQYKTVLRLVQTEVADSGDEPVQLRTAAWPGRYNLTQTSRRPVPSGYSHSTTPYPTTSSGNSVAQIASRPTDGPERDTAQAGLSPTVLR